MTRVGIGFDLHAFSSDLSRPLILGGVELPGHPGLDGHSDADVVAHAVADALLGAAGLSDIGTHFPDSDPSLVDADSVEILRRSALMVADHGWRLVNADCSVVAERPQLAPHIPKMVERLTDAAGGPVSVKAKRAEELGALGRGEGIACWAVALLDKR